MTGRIIAQYRVLARLGAGGMGEVYLAEDTRLGRKVALKVLPSQLAQQPLHLERFQREARAVAALHHPNIVTIYSVEEADGLHFLTMELVEGKTLAELIPPEGMDFARLLDVAIQVADALGAAHESGIVHRDIKPRNLMVGADGRVKVLDFGIAKRLLPEDQPTWAGGEEAPAQTITQEGQVIGTVAYMSPEQLRGQPLDRRTDLYSLGVVLYEMATGDPPYLTSNPMEQMLAMLERRPAMPGVLRPGLPRRFDEIVARCLELDPQQRYQSVNVLRGDLEALKTASRDMLLTVQAAPARRVSRRRNLAAAGAVAALLAAGAAYVLLRQQPAADPSPGSEAPVLDIPALAVLPFENLSGGEEYFADGMTDALIASLGNIGRVRVISRQSVMRYKGSDQALPAIARELGVDLILTGSVLRAGERVRIATHLVRAEPEQQLWAELYDRDLQDVLALQDEVARGVVREVRLELTEQEEARLTDARRVDPAVYDLYVQGRFQWDKRTPEGLRKAVEYFEQAIAADPAYAAAHAGLADAHALRGYFRQEPPEEAFAKARTAASRALALDPSLAEAHASLGFVRLYHDWDGAGAERELRRAVELNPSYASAHHWLWGYLSSVGRLAEAGEHLDLARRLNPFSPTIAAGLAAQSRMLRHLDLSIEQCRKAIDLEPGYALSHHYLWIALDRKGRFEEAFQEHQRALSLWGHGGIAGEAGRVLARSGYRSALVAAGDALAAAARRGTGRAPVQLLAETYAMAGDADKAIAWLAEGVERREPFVLWVAQMPEFDALRDDPRFRQLVQRVDRERSQ